jgi:hypothetical protein
MRCFASWMRRQSERQFFITIGPPPPERNYFGSPTRSHSEIDALLEKARERPNSPGKIAATIGLNA